MEEILRKITGSETKKEETKKGTPHTSTIK